jgi:hypothetical protein
LEARKRPKLSTCVSNGNWGDVPSLKAEHPPQPPLYLKSEGRRSERLHFSHSATFFTLPFSNRVFILISPPQEQKNFWVELEVREFLLAWAIVCLLQKY